MAEPQSPTFSTFNPSNDDRVTSIKMRTDTIVKLIKEYTESGGPGMQRRAALAITNYEQAAMWAVEALFSED